MERVHGVRLAVVALLLAALGGGCEEGDPNRGSRTQLEEGDGGVASGWVITDLEEAGDDCYDDGDFIEFAPGENSFYSAPEFGEAVPDDKKDEKKDEKKEEPIDIKTIIIKNVSSIEIPLTLEIYDGPLPKKPGDPMPKKVESTDVKLASGKQAKIDLPNAEKSDRIKIDFKNDKDVAGNQKVDKENKTLIIELRDLKKKECSESDEVSEDAGPAAF